MQLTGLKTNYDSKGYNILEGAPGKSHKFWFLKNNDMIAVSLYAQFIAIS